MLYEVLIAVLLLFVLYIGARLVFHAWFYTKKIFDKEE